MTAAITQCSMITSTLSKRTRKVDTELAKEEKAKTLHQISTFTISSI
jgi:hypothetical protein